MKSESINKVQNLVNVLSINRQHENRSTCQQPPEVGIKALSSIIVRRQSHELRRIRRRKGGKPDIMEVNPGFLV
jgi:hypothetical protein